MRRMLGEIEQRAEKMYIEEFILNSILAIARDLLQSGNNVDIHDAVSLALEKSKEFQERLEVEPGDILRISVRGMYFAKAKSVLQKELNSTKRKGIDYDAARNDTFHSFRSGD